MVTQNLLMQNCSVTCDVKKLVGDVDSCVYALPLSGIFDQFSKVNLCTTLISSYLYFTGATTNESSLR